MVPGFGEGKILSVDGTTLGYRREGTGVPVVLLHGIPTNSLLWRRLSAHLRGRADLIAPDLVGYGLSDKRRDLDLSIVSQAEWVISFIEQLGLSDVVLGGHDIGGGVAQIVTSERPDLVAHLLLVNTIAYGSWPEPNIARLKDPEWDERFESIDLRRGFLRGLRAGMADATAASERLAEMYAEPFMSAGARSYLRAARALKPEDLLTATEAIESITHPTTIIWGAQDPYQDIENGYRLANELEHADMKIFDDVGHFTPEEAPGRLSSIIVDIVLSSRNTSDER